VTADTFSSELGILSSSAPRLITAPWRTVPRGTNGGVTFGGLLAGLLGSLLIAVTSAVFVPFCPPEGPAKFNFRLLRFGTVDEAGWPLTSRLQFVLGITLLGFCGTLLDSLLGALLQASVVDSHTGKVVEGDGGRKVLVHGSSPSIDAYAEVRSKVEYGEGKKAVAKTSAVSDDNETRKRSEAAGAKSETGEKQESRKIAVGRDILDNNAVNFLMAATIAWLGIQATYAVWTIPKQVVNKSFY
jgi:uncharacterized membrane protein